VDFSNCIKTAYSDPNSAKSEVKALVEPLLKKDLSLLGSLNTPELQAIKATLPSKLDHIKDQRKQIDSIADRMLPISKGLDKIEKAFQAVRVIYNNCNLEFKTIVNLIESMPEIAKQNVLDIQYKILSETEKVNELVKMVNQTIVDITPFEKTFSSSTLGYENYIYYSNRLKQYKTELQKEEYTPSKFSHYLQQSCQTLIAKCDDRIDQKQTASYVNRYTNETIKHQHLDFIFELQEGFKESITLKGSAVTRLLSTDTPAGDIDLRILTDDIEETIEILTQKYGFKRAEDKPSYPGNIPKYYNFTRKCDGSDLEIQLTLGRLSGEFKYSGDELISTTNIGKAQPFTDIKQAEKYDRYYKLGKNRYMGLLPLEPINFNPDFIANQSEKKDELLFFPYTNSHKGYCHIVVKTLEKGRAKGGLDEEKIHTDYKIPSLADPSITLYSYAAIVKSMKKVFSEKMQGTDLDRRDCYLEISKLIQSRHNGIMNKDARPFLNYFLSGMIIYLKKSIIPVTLDSTQFQKDMVSILEYYYVANSFPSKAYDIESQCRQLVKALVSYRKENLNTGLTSYIILNIIEESSPKPREPYYHTPSVTGYPGTLYAPPQPRVNYSKPQSDTASLRRQCD